MHSQLPKTGSPPHLSLYKITREQFKTVNWKCQTLHLVEKQLLSSVTLDSLKIPVIATSPYKQNTSLLNVYIYRSRHVHRGTGSLTNKQDMDIQCTSQSNFVTKPSCIQLYAPARSLYMLWWAANCLYKLLLRGSTEICSRVTWQHWCQQVPHREAWVIHFHLLHRSHYKSTPTCKCTHFYVCKHVCTTSECAFNSKFIKFLAPPSGNQIHTTYLHVGVL